VANQVNIVINAQDKASQALGRVSDKATAMRGTFTKMAVAGGAIVGALGMVTKSALDQEIGINKLDSALKNVNTSYAQQAEAIEKTIRALQDKTNFGDEQQREALTTLVRLTGDYETSLQALPVVMDLAEGASMDFKGATVLMGKALTGEVSSLSRYGIKLESTATATEVLTKLTDQFGGSAESARDPLVGLQMEMGDLGQEIGDVLLPVIKQVLETLIPVIKGVVEWSDRNPGLMKTIVLVTSAIGGLLLVFGILGLALPPIIAGFGMLTTATGALTIAMSLNPVGAVLVGLSALALLIPVIIRHWDGFKDLMISSINKIIGVFELWFKWFNPIIGSINALITAWNYFNPDNKLKTIEVKLPRINTELDYMVEVTDKVTKSQSTLNDTMSAGFDDMEESVGAVTTSVGKLNDAVKGVGKTSEEVLHESNMGFVKWGISMVGTYGENINHFYDELMSADDRRMEGIKRRRANDLDEEVELLDEKLEVNEKYVAEYFDMYEEMANKVADVVNKAHEEMVHDTVNLHELIGMDENVLPGAGKGLPTLGTGGRGYTIPVGGLFNRDRTKRLTQAGLQMWEALGTKDKFGNPLGMNPSEIYQDKFAGKYFQNVIVSQDLAGVINVQQVGKTIAEKRGDATTFSGTEEYNL